MPSWRLEGREWVSNTGQRVTVRGEVCDYGRVVFYAKPPIVRVEYDLHRDCSAVDKLWLSIMGLSL